QLAEDVTNHYPVREQYLSAFDREPAEVVIIAFNSENRRDFFQSIDYFQIADITCVNDRINSLKDHSNGFIEQPMRVGYDSDFHHKHTCQNLSKAGEFYQQEVVGETAKDQCVKKRRTSCSIPVTTRPQ